MDQKVSDKCLDALAEALPILRGELHRYLSRMTGSVIEGEDVLQDALLAATKALQNGAQVHNMRAWLFRISHNTALNLFRSRKREAAMKEHLFHTSPTIQPTPEDTIPEALTPYLALTPTQRSIVILRDVLGYSTAEVADLTESSVTAVKSALHRGRTALTAARTAIPPNIVPLAELQVEALRRYADLFNAHNFDALRDMLSAEVRLDVVSVDQREGKALVSGYFGNYAKQHDWRMAPGIVEGRPAILAYDLKISQKIPAYFIVLDIGKSGVSRIRDFRYARYAMTDADWSQL
jgi:RNA polymerase sigma-70 factor (ECF subfamily)